MNDVFRSVSQIIANEPSLKKVRELLRNDEIMHKFFEIFPDLKNHVHPDKVTKGTLYIKVDNSVLRSELKFHDNEMLSKINEFFHEERIKKIRFFS